MHLFVVDDDIEIVELEAGDKGVQISQRCGQQQPRQGMAESLCHAPPTLFY
jgi:hypothetical protein